MARATAVLLVATAMWVAVAPGAGGQEHDGGVAEPETATLLQYGWWNKSQQSPGGGSGVPRPPDAPENGLYVAYDVVSSAPPGPTAGVAGAVPPQAPDALGPVAFGALRYSVPDGAEGELTLRFRITSTSSPGGASPDVGLLQACAVRSPWDPLQNGRFDQAPTYDCASAATAEYIGDTLRFVLPASLSEQGTFDLAIVPAGSRPFRVAIEAPDDASLRLTRVPETEVEAGDFGAAYEPDFTFDSFPSEVGDVGPALTPSPVLSRPAPTRAPTSPPARVQVGVPAGAAGVLGEVDRTEQIVAVGLLLGMALGMWWLGSRPGRAPRLLGAIGNGRTVELSAATPRGIGRFSRPRNEGEAPRLV